MGTWPLPTFSLGARSWGTQISDFSILPLIFYWWLSLIETKHIRRTQFIHFLTILNNYFYDILSSESTFILSFPFSADDLLLYRENQSNQKRMFTDCQQPTNNLCSIYTDIIFSISVTCRLISMFLSNPVFLQLLC